MRKIAMLGAALLLAALPAAAGEIVVLDDRLDDNSGGWWVGDDGTVAASVSAGRMHLTRRDAGGWATWRGVPRLHPEDGYRLEATVTITDDQDNYGCGLWFGAKDGNNGYVFEVGDEGQYRFFHYENGNWVDETSWQSSSAVHPGIGATNILSVVKQGGQWALYINGQYVNQVPARAFYGLNMGFRIEGRMSCDADRLLVVENEGPRAPPSIAVGAYPGPGERLVLDEPFDTNINGWNLGRDEHGSLSLEAGKLVVRHWAEGGYVYWIKPRIDPFAEHRVEALVRVVEDQDNYGCGLWYGAKDHVNGTIFEIGDEGQYRISRFENGSWYDETSWQSHKAVRPGIGAQNYITVVKTPERWFLYVNGVLVDRVPVRPLLGNGFGVRVEGRMACEVDHLRIVEGGGRLLAEAPVAPVLAPVEPVAPPPRVEEPPPRVEEPVVASGPPKVVAVFEVLDSSNRLSKQERADLTEYLMARLTARGGYSVVPTDTLKESLTQTKKESYKDCYDTSCQIALGKAVAAELVLTTKLLRVAGECAITATLFDVRKEATIKAATLDTRCEMKGLLDALKELVKQL